MAIEEKYVYPYYSFKDFLWFSVNQKVIFDLKKKTVSGCISI